MASFNLLCYCKAKETAIMSMRTTLSPFLQFHDLTVRRLPMQVLATHTTATTINFRSTNLKQTLVWRSINPFGSFGEGDKCFPKSISAVQSGVEASISDEKPPLVRVKNATIVVESQDDDKILIRVDVPGEDTQIVFDKVLASLARTAPPVPGFRRQKGGKTTNVPKSFLLQVVGEDRVTTFVIQEIINSTLGDYVTKENLKVKENKGNTTQSKEELKSLFRPGKEFGFNATLDLDKSEIETSSSSSETSEIEISSSSSDTSEIETSSS